MVFVLDTPAGNESLSKSFRKGSRGARDPSQVFSKTELRAAMVEVRAEDEEETGGGGSSKRRPEAVEAPARGWRANFIEFFKMVGPGWLIAVAYIDPGNLYADIAAGAEFEYSQIWVVWWATIFSLLIVFFCSRLVIFSGKDLARGTRTELYRTNRRWLNRGLWLLAEAIVVFTDIPEVIGFGFACNILFGMPVYAGVLLSAVTTFIFLFAEHFGLRLLEGAVAFLTFALGISLIVQLGLSGADAGKLLFGWWVPIVRSGSLYNALGIIGAVIMPHNLYLQASSVLCHCIRVYATAEERAAAADCTPVELDDFRARRRRSVYIDGERGAAPPVAGNIRTDMSGWVLPAKNSANRVIKFLALEPVFPLMFAFVINLSLMGVAAKNVFPLTCPGGVVAPGPQGGCAQSSGTVQIDPDTVGVQNFCDYLTFSGGCVLWGIALLASGQASTITTTLTGNYVMNGFLRMRIRPWVRAMTTRGLAILPALVVAATTSSDEVNAIIGIVNATIGFLLPIVLVPLIKLNMKVGPAEREAALKAERSEAFDAVDKLQEDQASEFDDETEDDETEDVKKEKEEEMRVRGDVAGGDDTQLRRRRRHDAHHDDDDDEEEHEDANGDKDDNDDDDEDDRGQARRAHVRSMTDKSKDDVEFWTRASWWRRVVFRRGTVPRWMLYIMIAFTVFVVVFCAYTLVAPDGGMFGLYTASDNLRWAVQANILQDVLLVAYLALVICLAWCI